MKPSTRYYSQEKRPEINITQTPQGVYIFHCVGGSSNYNVRSGQTTSQEDLHRKSSNCLRYEKKSPIIRSMLNTDSPLPACSGIFKEQLLDFN